MDKLKQRVCDVISYKKNIGVLQTQIQVLMEEVSQVQSLLMNGENDTKDEVQNWFAEASEIIKGANDIFEGRNNMADKKHLCSTCWYPTSSWETGQMLRGIGKILEERKGLDLSSYFCGLSYCKKLQSRENKLQDILKAVIDIHIDMIGIYGMIGVGKTLLAKELVRRAQNDQLFDVIVMVQVSESVDVKLIQSQIANKIGLQLSDGDDDETRAHFLYNALQEKITERKQQNDAAPVPQSKILVILDGLLHVVDIGKVGIPCEQGGRASCKVVLISRNADVCKKMGAEKQFLVECLNMDEAKILFQERLGDKIESMEITFERYQYMENVFLIKCRGLPLVIASLACTLRFKSWSNWEIIVDQMERHTLVEVDEVKEVPHAILELCNSFIQKGKNHKLFLLCCLVQKGMDLTLARLMSYAIGFALFEEDALTSVVDQINSWVDELKSLSLLVESRELKHVMVHDIVQDVAISAFSEGDYILPVLLDSGTCWHTRESYENCAAISMMHGPNYKFLSGLELHKLEAFLLKGYSSLCFPDHFFQGMQNLKILDISGITFVDFPPSIGDLKNLVTLHLENCDIKCGVSSAIGNLAKLEVLSLRESSVKMLPEEIGNLTNLRVLDLTRCTKLTKFCVDAVAKLDQLRGLYLYDIHLDWSTDDMKMLKSLPLEVLEIIIPTACQMSLSVLHLETFRICIGSCSDKSLKDFSSFSRVLLINGDVDFQLQESCLKDLLSLTEFLLIGGVKGLPNGVGALNKHGFWHLKELHLHMCSGMKCILDTSKLFMIQREVFPEVENLTLTMLYDLTSICRWLPTYSFFPKLRELRLKDLSQLYPYVLPIQLAVKLSVMEVSNCRSLLCIFPTSKTNGIDEADISVEFPCMETLELKDLKSLLALQDLLVTSIRRDEFGRPYILLFNEKIKFPSLKEMHLEGLDQIGSLWDFSGSKGRDVELCLQSQTWCKQPYGKSPNFGNLKYMTISNCNKLKSLFPCSVVASLLQLEKLLVNDCCTMMEVITSELEDGDNPTITFSKLQTLRLKSLIQLQCFYRGNLLLKFPMLRELDLFGLKEMKAFTLSDAQSVQTKCTLFTEKIKFPSLKEMRLKYLDQIEKIWDFSGSKEHAAELLQSQTWVKEPYGGSSCFANLKCITVSCCHKLESMFPSQIVNSLLQLEKLEIECCSSLKEVVAGDVEYETNLPTTVITFPNLQILKLWSLRRLQCFYQGGLLLKFPILRELNLFCLWEMKAFILPNTQSAQTQSTILFDGEIDFPSLEHLGVSCMDIELLQRHKETTILANLSRLTLRELQNLKSLPKINSKSLRVLDLQKIDCCKCKVLFSFQSTYMPSMLLMSRELEELRLAGFDFLEELIDDENSVDKCNPFDVKLLFSLRNLELCGFRQLKKIPWKMLRNLRSLIIHSLKGWACLISTTLLVGGDVLPLLESIEVLHCGSLESIIYQGEVQEQEEGHDFVKYGITLFPCLRQIHLYWLPKLENFSLGSYETHYPSLETVEIFKCRSMQSFSLGPLRTPRLKYVKLDFEIIEADEFDDLNSVVAAAAEEAEAKRAAEAKVKIAAEARAKRSAKARRDAIVEIAEEAIAKIGAKRAKKPK